MENVIASSLPPYKAELRKPLPRAVYIRRYNAHAKMLTEICVVA